MIDGPIIVDANALFGALLRDGTNRHLIIHGAFDLRTPKWLWGELQRRREFLVKKAATTDAAFSLLLANLQENIKGLPSALIAPHLPTALARLGDNTRDAPYVAAALAVEGGIWSHDKGLAETAGVPVWTTGDLIERT